MNELVTDGHTFVNPLGVAFTLLMGFLLVGLPRKYAFVPIIALICYMTMGMRLMVGGLNFTMMRVLLIFGWIRLVARGELRPLSLNSIDKAVVWYTIVSAIAYVILWEGEADAFKYKLGKAYDCIGFYFLFRYLLEEWEDIVQLVRTIAFVAIPLGIEMALERLTLVNQFSIFGGVQSNVWLRNGTPRCQGPFSHPILAGTFGATLIPLFIALGFQKSNRWAAVLGLLSAAVITGTAGSSGPVMACACGVAAIFFWPLRNQMRVIRWAMASLLVALHFSMKAPVWFLIGRFSVYDSSTGFHRAYLIDRAMANLSEWWLVGVQTTSQWGEHLFDVTNQYIRVGVEGGIAPLWLFISIIVLCFRGVGRVVREMDERGMETDQRFLVWGLGAIIVVHVMSFISVSYFDQNLIMWYLLLAVISSVCSIFLDSRLRPLEAEDSTYIEQPLEAPALSYSSAR